MPRFRFVLYLALAACGGGHAAKPESPATTSEAAPAAAAATPAVAPTTSAAPEMSAAPTTSAAPADPAASKRLRPPQRWEEIGHRGTETVLMGFIEWKGGESVDIQVMGTMGVMMQNQIAEAIKQKPDDPGGAIQEVIDMFMSMKGDLPIEWIRK